VLSKSMIKKHRQGRKMLLGWKKVNFKLMAKKSRRNLWLRIGIEEFC
jgi:hypothetical protein